MKTIKVAFLHNIISPYRVPLFEELSRQHRIDLHVYFCAETHKIRKWSVIHSESYNYEVLPGVTFENSNISFHINPSIITKIIKGKYDVIIISGNPDFTTYATFITSKLLKIPIVWWSEGIESAQSKLGKLITPLTKYIVKNVDSIVVPGSLSKAYHVKIGANPEKIFFAPNIVNNEQFIKNCHNFKAKKNDFKKELGFENKKIILYVGQLIERKGVEYLISAYEKLKDEEENIALVIVGDGNFKDRLEAICNDNNIEDVYFKGWVSEEQKILFYTISDLFVFPTLKDVWGLVVNEAMCCGLPVISTKAAGSSVDMIITGENGYIVDPKDEKQIYFTMKDVLLDEIKQGKMGKKSIEIINNKFTTDSMVNGFVLAIQFALIHCVKKETN